MKLFVAGGCGEHGRNCFFVDCGDIRFLVDCGIMAAESSSPSGGYPYLSKAQIASLDFVFLTHSHADHTGALPWLYAQGCRAPLIATQETFAQCSFDLSALRTHPLNTICPDGKGTLKNLALLWGRSGHCEGSVWYKMAIGEKTILFSGDYTEASRLYVCDRLRGQTADLAVLDCAYGNDAASYAEACHRLLERMKSMSESHRQVLLPVPKFGRGIELLSLLSENLQNVPFYGDALFLSSLKAMRENPFWFQTEQAPAVQVQPYAGQTDGIVFVSDPQLRTAPARKITQDILARGGAAVATGTVENGSYSAELLAAGQMELFRYPVHLNHSGCELLKRTNRFAQTVLYHSDAISVCSPIQF